MDTLEHRLKIEKKYRSHIQIQELSFTPDYYIYYESPANTAVREDTRTNEIVPIIEGFPGSQGAYTLDVDRADNRIIISCDYNPRMYIYEYDSGSLVAIEQASAYWTNDLVMDRQKNVIYRVSVINSEDNVRMFDYSGNDLGVINSFAPNCGGMAADFDEDLFFYVSDGGEIYKWKPNEPREFVIQHPANVRRKLGIDPVNDFIYYCGESTIIRCDYNGNNVEDTGIIVSSYNHIITCYDDNSLWFNRPEGTFMMFPNSLKPFKVVDTPRVGYRLAVEKI